MGESSPELAAFLLPKMNVMCLRKDNGVYSKKECTRQCNNCKAQEAMQWFLQLATVESEENVPNDMVPVPAFLHQNQNQNIPYNYPLHT